MNDLIWLPSKPGTVVGTDYPRQFINLSQFAYFEDDGETITCYGAITRTFTGEQAEAIRNALFDLGQVAEDE